MTSYEDWANRRYSVIQELTSLRGGQGSIFLAKDRRFDRNVLIKKLRPGAATAEDTRLRFEREAKVTAQLQHPGIPHVYDSFIDHDGLSASVMEFICEASPEGVAKKLDDLIPDRIRIVPTRDSAEFCRLIDVLIQVCSTVEYAHARGLIHRDLKCTNVLVTDNRVVVVDWGLVKALAESEVLVACNGVGQDGDAGETDVGDKLGTIPYTAPEQLVDPTCADQRSDIYSVGVMLYRVLTGRLPAANRNELVPPRELNAKVPTTIEAICKKAIAEQPEDRYQSMAALKSDLTNWTEDRPITAHPDRSGNAWRVARRHQIAVVSTLMALLGTMALLLHGSWLTRRHNQELTVINNVVETQRDGFYDAIKDLFNAATKHARQYPEKDGFRGEILSSAKQHVERALTAAPVTRRGRVFQAQANYRLAQYAHQTKDLELWKTAGTEALAQFNKLSHDFPDDHRFQFDVFHCQFLLERHAAALETVESLCAVHRTPDYLDAFAAAAAERARSLLEVDEAEAERLARLGLEQAQQLASEFCDQSKYRRHIATNTLVLADLASNRGELYQAYELAKASTEEYRRLLSANPDEISFIRDTVITATVAASAAFESGRVAESRATSELGCQVIREALLRDNRELKRWHLLVFAVRQQLDLELIPDTARPEHLNSYLAELEFARRAWPNDTLLRISLAQVYVLLGGRADAWKLVRELSIDEVRPDTLGMLGLIYLEVGDVEIAERCFSNLHRDRLASAYDALILAHQGKHLEASKLIDSMHRVKHLPAYARIRREIKRLSTVPASNRDRRRRPTTQGGERQATSGLNTAEYAGR